MAIIKNEAGTHSLAIEADGSLNVNLTSNGSATAAKQDVGNASLSSIDTKLSGTLSVNVVNQIDLTTVTSHLLAIKNSVAAIDANTDTVEQKLTDVVTAINANGTVNHADLASILTQLQAVNANTDGQEALLSSILAKIIASPATLSEQQTQSASLASIDTKLSNPLTVNVGLTDAQLRASAVPVSVSGVSTSANQVTGNSSLSNIDTKTPALVTGRVPVDGSGVTQPVSFTRLNSASDSVTTVPSGTQTISGTVAATQSGTWNVTNISGAVSLPTGAATAAKQLADNHQVTVSNFPATQVVSAVALPLPTGASTATLQTTGNSTLTAIDTKLGATLSVNVGLTDTQLRASAVPISVATLPLPSTASTSTLQTTGNTTLSSIDTKLGGTLSVNVGLTDTQLRATPVPISGTVSTGGLTDTQLRASAVPVSVSGVATAANQTTGNASLASIDSKTATLVTGRVPVDGSAVTQPVSFTRLASVTDSVTIVPSGTQTVSGTITANAGTGNFTIVQATAANLNANVSGTVAATQSGTWNVTNVSGTVSLPNGASTSANQVTTNSSLSSIDGKTPTLVSGRQPVDGSGVTQPVLANDVITSGSIAANGASVVLAITGQSSYAVQVTGTWVGTLQFEGSVDGTNYTPLVVRLAGTSTYIINASTNTIYRGNCSAYKNIRVISIAWTSGTASIAMAANLAVGGVFINSEVRPKSADLTVTSTAAAASPVTLTLPAAGTGLFHYITKLEVTAVASAARTAAATPVVVTTTNLAGSLAYSFQANAAAQGVSERQVNDFFAPLKSSVANTATTIVAPATTSVIWRVTAHYYTGA